MDNRLREAATNAVDTCVERGILTDYMTSDREHAIEMVELEMLYRTLDSMSREELVQLLAECIDRGECDLDQAISFGFTEAELREAMQ